MNGTTAAGESGRKRPKTASSRRRVMVIYGRDEANCGVLCDFLEGIGLEPVTFREVLGKLTTRWGDDGPPAELLMAAIQQCQAAVVLLTPDDDARLGAELCFGVADAEHRQMRGQARASVYFEAGLAKARLPHRTIVLEAGIRALAEPNLGASIDVSVGRVWQDDLHKALRAAGCLLPDEPPGVYRKLDFIRRKTPSAVKKLGFADVEAALDSVIQQVRGWRTPDCIIGVEGGGAVVAGMLGQHFGIDSVEALEVVKGRGGEAMTAKWRGGSEPEDLDRKRSTLVVGDVLRRDARMLGAREFLSARVRPEMRTAALASACAPVTVGGGDRARPIPDFLGVAEVNEGGVLMPWEAEG